MSCAALYKDKVFILTGKLSSVAFLTLYAFLSLSLVDFSEVDRNICFECPLIPYPIPAPSH